jgi:hypothetical protein
VGVQCVQKQANRDPQGSPHFFHVLILRAD